MLTFEKHHFKQIIYFLLLFAFFTSQIPSPLFAEICIVNDPEEEWWRTRTATTVLGVTVAAVILGGITYAVLASSRSCRRRHRDSSYCDSYASNRHRHRHRHHHDRRHHHHAHRSQSSDWYSEYSPSEYYTSNPYSIFSENNETDFSGESLAFIDPQIARPFVRSKGFPKSPSSRRSKEESQLSGTFISHPSLSSGQGSFTAFVELPDGTTQVVGHIPFSSSQGSSLSYGPFTQKGTYTFRMSLDEGTALTKQAKIGSVEVNIDGSTVQSEEFLVPAHPPAHYEPSACHYDL